jgi:hypothetical protein
MLSVTSCRDGSSGDSSRSARLICSGLHRLPTGQSGTHRGRGLPRLGGCAVGPAGRPPAGAPPGPGSGRTHPDYAGQLPTDRRGATTHLGRDLGAGLPARCRSAIRMRSSSNRDRDEHGRGASTDAYVRVPSSSAGTERPYLHRVPVRRLTQTSRQSSLLLTPARSTARNALVSHRRPMARKGSWLRTPEP